MVSGELFDTAGMDQAKPSLSALRQRYHEAYTRFWDADTDETGELQARMDKAERELRIAETEALKQIKGQ